MDVFPFSGHQPIRAQARRGRALFAGALRLVLCAIVLLASDAAYAKGLVDKRFHFEERKGTLTITGGFRELFDHKLRERLRSGFATTVVMRVYLYQSGGGKALAVSARTLRAVYDLWEQRYLLRIEEPGHSVNRRFRSQRAIVDRLTSFWRFPLRGIAGIKKGKTYFVATIVEVNPMRPEVLAEIRRWLRRPATRPRQIGGQSIFGSFVSIFVNNKIRRAQKTFKVRSQPFFRR